VIPRIALTSGEPAGVGPELCLAIAREALDCELVCLADRSLLAARAAALKLPVTLAEYDAPAARAARSVHVPDRLPVLHIPLGAPSAPGQLDRRNGR
jgi:4-hydroxythreonine-4-phosphate dehydrogenase